MALQFQRNAKVYAKIANTTSASPDSGVWQIPVLAGFSFSQSANSSEITINEAGSTSRRARLLFNDSIAPVEWSFSTYIRPTSITGPTTVIAPEQVLWAMLMGANGYQAASRTFYSTQVGRGSPSPASSPSPALSPFASPGDFGGSFINNATQSGTNVFDFSSSNVSSFPDGNILYVAFEDGNNKEYFTLSNIVVNSVTIDFDIEGIATAQWSGFARSISRTGTAPTPIASPITDGVLSTSNFIRNRLSTISLQNNKSGGDTYSIVLTGGSFTVENNISYLLPEQLGQVNTSIANITGTRTISGSITCYYDNDTTAFKSAELWNDLVTDTSTVRNSHNLQINIGGTSGPRLILNLPTAHVEIPSIGVDDLLTLEANFHGIVANGDVDQTSEAYITYAV